MCAAGLVPAVFFYIFGLTNFITMSKTQLIQKVVTGRKYIADHAHRPECPVFRHYQIFLQLIEMQYGTVNVEQLNVIVTD